MRSQEAIITLFSPWWVRPGIKIPTFCTTYALPSSYGHLHSNYEPRSRTLYHGVTEVYTSPPNNALTTNHGGVRYITELERYTFYQGATVVYALPRRRTLYHRATVAYALTLRH